VLREETLRRIGPDTGEENPYWQAEEPDEDALEREPGCVRSGRCCRSSPGWFGPGQIEKAAEFLEMEADIFARTYLVIDHTEVDGVRVEVFAPLKLGRDGAPLVRPLSRADRLYQLARAPCIFFDGAGCRIHGAHPVECAAYVCTNAPEDNLSHERIARAWQRGEPVGEEP
jgi:Fe-S-cluster containining protein